MCRTSSVFSAAAFYRIQNSVISLCLPFSNLKFTLNDLKSDSLSR
ncbi:hypothetical protein CLOSTHATH_05487 [Hungatella hathewayi DSM 13479]|uniref:Uncharacterized protein n=1 Tax=Hungatella hathewayi DSM 13479 TaxID=566550 RepID=D3APD4_9FIRM|nr:hypothetical protein CLOSTHATH_05487 [Hungatella hathewayi DSM 13479]